MLSILPYFNKLSILSFPDNTDYKAFLIPFAAIIFSFILLIAFFFLLDFIKSEYPYQVPNPGNSFKAS